MKKWVPFFGLMVGVLLSACDASSQEAEETVTPPVAETDKKVALPTAIQAIYNDPELQQIQLQDRPGESFVVYFPSTAEKAVNHNVLFLFDPHGNGKAALSPYKAIADSLGWVITCSNSSKNGLAPDFYTAHFTAWKSALENTTGKTIGHYGFAGFSGGAKVALGLWQQGERPVGIITVGNPNPEIALMMEDQPKVLALVGTRDFNFINHQKAWQSSRLEKVHLPYLTFDDNHTWPDASTVLLAAQWLEQRSGGDFPKSDNHFLSQVKTAGEKRDLVTLERLTAMYRAPWFTAYKNDGKTVKTIRSLGGFDAQLQQQASILANELEATGTLRNLLTSGDFSTLKERLLALKSSCDTTSYDPQRASDCRQLAVISMMCYGMTARLIQARNTEQAARVLEIYALVDPQNPDVHYFKAQLHRINGDKAAAIASLQTALDYGFKDAEQLSSNPMIADLPGVHEVVQLLRN